MLNWVISCYENSVDPDQLVFNLFWITILFKVRLGFQEKTDDFSNIEEPTFCGSGRVLGSIPSGCGFEPHWRHCVVSLSKTLYSLLSTCSTREDQS